MARRAAQQPTRKNLSASSSLAVDISSSLSATPVVQTERATRRARRPHTPPPARMSPSFSISWWSDPLSFLLAVPIVQAEHAPRRTARRPSASQPACMPLLSILKITNPLISFSAVLVAEAERDPRQGNGHVGEPPDQGSQPARMSPSCLSYKLLIHYHSPAILVVHPQHAPRQTTRRSPLPQPARMSLPLSIQNLLIRHRLPQPFQLHKASIFRAGHREIGNLLGLYPLARTSD